MTQPPYNQPDDSPVPPPTPYPPAPQYSAPGSYPAAGYPAEPTPVKKSPVLGYIGLALVVIAAIVFIICCHAIAAAIIAAVGPHPLANANSQNAANLGYDLGYNSAAEASGSIMGATACTVIGIAGFVISIVATAQNKGRIFGIIGIILGVLAPVIGSIMMQVALS